MSNVKANTTQVRFGGVGGQGIVLSGRLLGKAAALFDGKDAVCTQSYGPEARGGASRADVVISNGPVDYPFVTQADVLVAFFHEAYVKFRTALKPGGLLIYDTALVHSVPDEPNAVGLPATAIAEEIGSKLAANVVMLGFLVGKTGVVSREAAEEAMRVTVKPRILDLNMRAFAAGFDLARSEAAA